MSHDGGAKRSLDVDNEKRLSHGSRPIIGHPDRNPCLALKVAATPTGLVCPQCRQPIGCHRESTAAHNRLLVSRLRPSVVGG
jgi:hypothetical protein